MRSAGTSATATATARTLAVRYVRGSGTGDEGEKSATGTRSIELWVFYFLGQGGLYVTVVLSPLSNLNSALTRRPALGHFFVRVM